MVVSLNHVTQPRELEKQHISIVSVTLKKREQAENFQSQSLPAGLLKKCRGGRKLHAFRS
jgi:hypothetical protein